MSRYETRSFRGTLVVFAILGGLGGAAFAQGDAQQVSGGGVTVTVTYLKERTDELAFRVALDTHSVSLDGYQLDSIIFLRDETYHWTNPAGLEAVSGAGHHRQAVVKFPRPSEGLDVLEMVVHDVAGVKDRHFNWKLE